MQFGDPEKAIGSLMKLAICPLVLLVAFSAVGQVINKLSALDLLTLLGALVLLSPIAYFILQSQRQRSDRPSRRGAERLPLLPPREEQ